MLDKFHGQRVVFLHLFKDKGKIFYFTMLSSLQQFRSLSSFPRVESRKEPFSKGFFRTGALVHP